MAANVINIRERSYLAEVPANDASKKSVASSYVPANLAWTKGSAANRNVAIGNAAIGNAAIGNATIGNNAIGNAAIGNATIGNATIGNATIGNNAIENAAIGNAAIGNNANRNAAIENDVTNPANRNAAKENVVIENAANENAVNRSVIRRLCALHAAVFTAKSLTGAHSTVTLAHSALHAVSPAIPALDLFAGIPQSALTQVCIPQSMACGRMAILCSLLSQATNREEVCALIDAGDSFDTTSAALAGADLSRLLWVRCGKKPAAAPGINPSLLPHAENNFPNNPLQCATNSPAASDNHPFLSQYCGNNSHPSLDGKSPGLDGRPSSRSRRHAPGVHTTASAPKADKQNTNGRENPKALREQNSGKTNTRRMNADERKNVQPKIRNVEVHCSHPVIRSAETRCTPPETRSASARRLQPIEQAFKAADILIQNGGFSLIVIDLGEIDERLVRKIPLTTWFRFARVIERQPTALVVFATYPAAQSCAALTLHIKNAAARWSATPRNGAPTQSAAASHAQFLSGLTCEVELGRVRGKLRRPVQCAGSQVNERTFSAIPVWK